MNNTPRQTSPQELQHLQERHQEVLRLRACGVTVRQIAEACGFTPLRVRQICQSRLGQARLAELGYKADLETMEVVEEINEIVPSAIDTFRRVIEGEEEEATVTNRLAAAEHVLSMAGYGKTNKIQHDHGGRIGLDMVVEQGLRLKEERRLQLRTGTDGESSIRGPVERAEGTGGEA